MAYPTLPDAVYLHPNPSHHQSYKSASGSPASNDPITPEIPHLSASHQRRVSDSTDADDKIPCQWKDCDYAASSPDELYDHLCNIHVGRKSTNNLCLVCKWDGCGVKCVKRDHITSHLRGKRSCFNWKILLKQSSTYSVEASSLWCVRKDIQAASGSEEA